MEARQRAVEFYEQQEKRTVSDIKKGAVVLDVLKTAGNYPEENIEHLKRYLKKREKDLADIRSQLVSLEKP